MKAYWKYLIIGVAIVVSAWLLARAYTYKYHAQETIVVTGLGETCLLYTSPSPRD